MDYKASMDTMAKGMTIFVTLLFAYTIYAMTTKSGSKSWPLFSGGIIALLLATYIICFGLSTWRYKVTDSALVIITPFYNKVINKSNIASADTVQKEQLGSVIRTFGNGGLFGYYGWFRSSVIGSFFCYSTQSKNRILIQLKNGEKYVISPDDLSLLSAIKPTAQTTL